MSDVLDPMLLLIAARPLSVRAAKRDPEIGIGAGLV